MQMSRAFLALLLLNFASCTYFSGDSRVLVTSDPAGAQILVDGSATGYWTPHYVDLAGLFGGNHEITLRKRGFEDETRTVYQYDTAYTSRWLDGGDTDTFFSAPLFWTIGDFMTPFAVRWQYVPQKLFVTLYPEGEAPLRQTDDSNQ